MPMKRLWPAVWAGLLVLAACGGPSAPAAGTKTDLLDFTVTTLDGAKFEGKSLAGKPAVLWFWAPWCPTCLGQAPWVKQVATAYAGKVTFVGVAGLDKESEMRWFVDLTKLDNMPHLADEEGVVWKRFGIAEQSLFVVLDASGSVVGRGRLDEDELKDKLTALAG